MDDQNIKKSVTLAKLKKIAHSFADEREWHQFHTPKNLSMAISIEAAELMELFMWENGLSEKILSEKKEAIEHEVADILLALLLFCNNAHIDLEAAFEKKMEINRAKYPVEKSKGKSAKYTEYHKA